MDDILKGIENFEINFKHANDHQYSSNSSSNEKIKIPSTQRKSQNTLKNEIKHNDDNCNIIRNSLTINREEYLISLGQSEQSEDSKKAYNRVKNEIIQLIGNSTYGDIYDLFKEMSSAEDLNDGDLELFEAYVESIVDSNSVERFYELFYKVVYHENIINKL